MSVAGNVLSFHKRFAQLDKEKIAPTFLPEQGPIVVVADDLFAGTSQTRTRISFYFAWRGSVVHVILASSSSPRLMSHHRPCVPTRLVSAASPSQMVEDRFASDSN